MRLSYEKGSSDLIQIADYFTRDNDYSRKYSQKLPDEKEIDKVEKVATKFKDIPMIYRFLLYTSSLLSYILITIMDIKFMESLLNIPRTYSVLDKIKNILTI